MANRLRREKIEELWQEFQQSQSIHEVARKCGVHHRTVLRYSRMDKWVERLAAITAKAQHDADYTLAEAMAQSLRLARIYKDKLSAALDAKKVDADAVNAAELERIAKLESFLLGGVEGRHEFVGRFNGWSDEELREYAESGRCPPR